MAMNRLFTVFCAIFISCILFAQAPAKISYQAVIRNSSNVLVNNTIMGMQISILQDSFDGEEVYVETHTPESNENGLITIEIGIGTTTDDFSSIDWSSGTYFIKTETDIEGGTNYTITGISQILSVPYAFHANTADSLTGALNEIDPVFNSSVSSGITEIDTAYWNNKQDELIEGPGIYINSNTISTGPFYFGQDTLGGIVYHIYIGSDGRQHGLLVSKTEGVVTWGDNISVENSYSDGAYNTELMSAQAGTARNWVEVLGEGWFVPSFDEFNLLWNNRFHVNNSTASGLTQIASNPNLYWCSTVNPASIPYAFQSYQGYPSPTSISNSNLIRGVKAF
jgi:hypothetical protein